MKNFDVLFNGETIVCVEANNEKEVRDALVIRRRRLERGTASFIFPQKINRVKK